MLSLNTLYATLLVAIIDSAIYSMYKCRSLYAYFVPADFNLAKVYQAANKPLQSIDVLQKMMRLPNRAADDAMLKAKGQAMLEKMK